MISRPHLAPFGPRFLCVQLQEGVTSTGKLRHPSLAVSAEMPWQWTLVFVRIGQWQLALMAACLRFLATLLERASQGLQAHCAEISMAAEDNSAGITAAEVIERARLSALEARTTQTRQTPKVKACPVRPKLQTEGAVRKEKDKSKKQTAPPCAEPEQRDATEAATESQNQGTQQSSAEAERLRELQRRLDQCQSRPEAQQEAVPPPPKAGSSRATPSKKATASSSSAEPAAPEPPSATKKTATSSKTWECPVCGSPMEIRHAGRGGKFYGCTMWASRNCDATRGGSDPTRWHEGPRNRWRRKQRDADP